MASKDPVNGFRRFSSALSSAVLEWMLMFLLFLEAWFSYMVTKFSRVCRLQTPCMCCSRLDHIFGKEKPDFYLDLICENHRAEISPSTFCTVHGKLADIRNICLDCLTSPTNERKSSPETYRSLIGNFREHFNDHDDVQAVDNDGFHEFYGDGIINGPSLKKHDDLCSTKSLEDKSIRANAVEVDIPSSSSAGHSYLQIEDQKRKSKRKTLVSGTNFHLKNQAFDRFSHVGYTEVKIASDSESEVPLTDDDEGKCPVRGDENIQRDSMPNNRDTESVAVIKNSFSECLSEDRAQENSIHLAADNVSDDKVLQELIHFSPGSKRPSESIPDEQINIDELHVLSTFRSSIAPGHCLELDDDNWNQTEVKGIPQHCEFRSEDSPEILVDSDVKGTISINDAKDWSEAVIHPSSSDNATEPGQSMNTDMDLNDAYRFALGNKESLSSPGASEEITREDSSRVQEDLKSLSGNSMNAHMDLNDAYKNAIDTKGNLLSPRFSEVIMGKDSSRVQEDLKLLISQISAAQGLESPWNEMSPSPRSYGQGEEFVIQHITKTLSLERNESGLESLDGSIVSEVEGESATERLKRQLELDRRSISLLYKELEEERNASAIAANQAMAMITRLQEEKASMQMEALHYQRMMEEQAEYDDEALQKCNDLLAEREKEIQDLEAELESYRKRFSGELSATVEQSGNFHDKEIAFCDKSRKSRISRIELVSSNDPLILIEDEKSYISSSLKKLEKKLHLFSNNGIYDDSSSFNLNDHDENGLPDKACMNARGEDFEERNAHLEAGMDINGQYSNEIGVSSLEQLHQKNGPLEGSLIGENSLKEEKISTRVSNSFEGEDNDRSDIHKQNILNPPNINEFVALENEVTRLSKRLEALEADRNFLEHAINSLRNGDDGVRFIQEIACDLRELRRICITQRDHLVS